MNNRWSAFTSATVATDQTVRTAPSARAAATAMSGRMPSRKRIATLTARAAATSTAESRLARKATDSTGRSCATQPITTYVGYPVGWVIPKTRGTVCISPQSPNAIPGNRVRT